MNKSVFLYPVIFCLTASLADAQTLTTKNYIVKIISSCSEEAIDCNGVEYIGTNRKNKKSLRLKGFEMIHYCKDDVGDGPGKTPCRHEGYMFVSGKTYYQVFDNGRLQVTRGATTLVDESGIWNYDK